MAKTAKKTTKPAAREGVLPIVLRLPPALIESLDAWADRLNEGATGPQWSRTDVIRAALSRAVEERGTKGETP